MKIVHWTDFPASGMNYFADSLVKAEKVLGLNSQLVNVKSLTEDGIDSVMDADIHVAHTHLPSYISQRSKNKNYKTIFMLVTPIECSFFTSITESILGYGSGDPWMVFQHALKTSDAIVTFGPRYTQIIKTMVDKATIVFETYTGIDKSFWHPVPCEGKYSGNPSVLWAETAMARGTHNFKSPYDLLITWPMVTPRVKGAPCLHLIGIRPEFHRWVFPLINSNDCSYTSHVASSLFDHNRLRAVLSAVDYFIGLVDYGDTNMLCMQANACGVKTISYPGNPFSDFWIPAGDQRFQADALVDIFNNKTQPRAKTTVPAISETALAMESLYKLL